MKLTSMILSGYDGVVFGEESSSTMLGFEEGLGFGSI